VRRLATAALLVGLGLSPASAHDAPYSFLDLRLRPTELDGALTAHVYDLAHELGLAQPDSLLDSTRAAMLAPRLAGILGPRLHLSADGAPLRLRFSGTSIERAHHGVTLRFTAALAQRPGTLDLEAQLFPYDPQHETYVNVYEGDSLRLQTLLDHKQDRARLYSRTQQGRWAVIATFLMAGVQHIFTGPDHVLFVIALLLLGGGIARLLKIVTAFTLAHSITLALATLRIVDPPARVIEPMIALSIVLVGFDNLRAAPGRDHRTTLAFLFGLVHGFGFASVLREMDLPAQAIGWSLLSFNIGVEIGQLVVVAFVAATLAAVARHSQVAGRRVAFAGSLAVIGAGAFWFVQRVLFVGGNL